MGLLTETCLLAQQSLPSQHTKPQVQEKRNTQNRKSFYLEVRGDKQDVEVVDPVQQLDIVINRLDVVKTRLNISMP